MVIHKFIEEKKQNLYNLIKEKLKYSSRSSFDVKSVMLKNWIQYWIKMDLGIAFWRSNGKLVLDYFIMLHV